VIGPLVPTEVNAANLRLGNAEYERLLGVNPRMALVNEQAYSSGLLASYIDAGHDAIFMEWDNPVRVHPEWDPAMRYLPQVACGHHGERIGLIWNHSTAFQKFQRYAHGEMGLQEYFDYLAGHASDTPRAFPLYGNDIEVFDFRPGRYQAEPMLEHGEWDRIGDLFHRFTEDPRFEFASPSEILAMSDLPGAGTPLHLESSELPIPVKKQGKYNVTRWAVTGRDDLGINTRCWRLYEQLRDSSAGDDEWRELCYLWSSDFRTHITDQRWTGYLERLSAFESRMGLTDRMSAPVGDTRSQAMDIEGVDLDGRFLTVSTPTVTVRLNMRRGLTIDRLSFPGCGEDPVVGTLPHGYFDDINMTADFYTGHVVFEGAGRHKVTNLGQVEPRVYDDDEAIIVEGEADTPMGPIKTRVTVAVVRDA